MAGVENVEGGYTGMENAGGRIMESQIWCWSL